MMHSSGDSEWPADHTADNTAERPDQSSAERPAHQFSDVESTTKPTMRTLAEEEARKLSPSIAGDSSGSSMERGLFLRTSFGNLGEGQWFVHRVLQLAGRPTHRCLKCLNRLAWTCKQIHTWFYSIFNDKSNKCCTACSPIGGFCCRFTGVSGEECSSCKCSSSESSQDPLSHPH